MHSLIEEGPSIPQGVHENPLPPITAKLTVAAKMAKLITASLIESKFKVKEKLGGNLFLDVRLDNFEVSDLHDMCDLLFMAFTLQLAV